MNQNERPIDLLKWTCSVRCVVVLSFPEGMEGDAEEPESPLSWLPAPLRKPLVAGYLIIHLLWPTWQPFVFHYVFGPPCLCLSGLYSCCISVCSYFLFQPSNALGDVVIINEYT